MSRFELNIISVPIPEQSSNLFRRESGTMRCRFATLPCAGSSHCAFAPLGARRRADGGRGCGGRSPSALPLRFRAPPYGFFGRGRNEVRIVCGSIGWNEPQGSLVSHKHLNTVIVVARSGPLPLQRTNVARSSSVREASLHFAAPTFRRTRMTVDGRSGSQPLLDGGW